MDLNNIYGDYLVKRRVTMMLQFVYKGDGDAANLLI